MRLIVLSCLCLAGPVCFTAADPSSYSPDLGILSRALQSSRSKVRIMGDKITEMTSAAGDLFSSLDFASSGIGGSVNNINNMQDTSIAEASDKLNELLDDLQDVTGDAVEASRLAGLNRDRLSACLGQVEGLANSNDLQDAQIDAAQSTVNKIMTKVQNTIDAQSSLADEVIENVLSKLNATESLLNSQRCFLGQTTVNLTDGIGVEDVLFPAEFFPSVMELPDTAVPVAYCAITGLISAINEQESTAYGYGYAPSDREHTGFALDCAASLTGVTVTLVDRSQSEKGKDKTLLVSVSIKACTFSAKGEFNLFPMG